MGEGACPDPGRSRENAREAEAKGRASLAEWVLGAPIRCVKSHHHQRQTRGLDRVKAGDAGAGAQLRGWRRDSNGSQSCEYCAVA